MERIGTVASGTVQHRESSIPPSDKVELKSHAMRNAQL